MFEESLWNNFQVALHILVYNQEELFIAIIFL
jgi:hypothetical protein